MTNAISMATTALAAVHNDAVAIWSTIRRDLARSPESGAAAGFAATTLAITNASEAPSG
jgi:hypothetical protein